MLEEKKLTSNFLPTRNLEITTNILYLFKKLFEPSQFNNTIRNVFAMKKWAIAISSIELFECQMSIWQVRSIQVWMVIKYDFFDYAREDTAFDWDSDTYNILSLAALFFVPLFSLATLYDFKYCMWNLEGILPVKLFKKQIR